MSFSNAPRKRHLPSDAIGRPKCDQANSKGKKTGFFIIVEEAEFLTTHDALRCKTCEKMYYAAKK